MFFLHPKKIWDSETCTHRLQTEVFTDRLFCTQKLYPEQFLHSRNFFAQKPLRTKTNMHSSFHRQTVFTHRKFSAQKSYAQKVFTHSNFYIKTLLHTDVCTQIQTAHRYKLHTETCAHRNLCTQNAAFTHSQLLHREALLSPSQVWSWSWFSPIQNRNIV